MIPVLHPMVHRFPPLPKWACDALLRRNDKHGAMGILYVRRFHALYELRCFRKSPSGRLNSVEDVQLLHVLRHNWHSARETVSKYEAGRRIAAARAKFTKSDYESAANVATSRKDLARKLKVSEQAVDQFEIREKLVRARYRRGKLISPSI